jgi:hypothetical protein
MAIKYEEVNHVASSKESRSAAMDDWVVVRMDILAPVIDEHDVRSPAVRAESRGQGEPSEMAGERRGYEGGR